MSEKVILPGSHREHPKDSTVIAIGVLDSMATITLSMRGSVPLLQTAHGTTYGCSPEDIAVVEKWADENGFSVDAIHVPAKTIKISGSLHALAKVFEAQLQLNADAGAGWYRTRSGDIMLPKELDSIVRGVFGFDQRPVAKTHHTVRAQDSIGSTSYTPQQVAKAYDFPTNTGSGQTIGIIELGGGYSNSDLAAYWKEVKVPTVSVTAVGVDGASNSPSGDPNSADGEVALDIQVIGAIAPAARIAVYFAPNTDQGFLDAINAAIHDTVRKPSVISISWGGPETNWQPQTMTAFNAAFQDAALLGISVTVASGDSGSSDGTDGNAVDFPASSPWALGCGGTTLRVDHNLKITSETVWNDGANGGASGGGESVQFVRPAYYQNGINLAGTGRGVPDVAGNADPETGYVTIVDGQKGIIGGTSAVAPLWAALIALCNQELKEPCGWIGKVLYLSAPAGTLNDITVGNNGAYTAQPGWDACTGLGSPNGAKVLELLKIHRGTA